MARAAYYWCLGVFAFLGCCELAFRCLPVSTATETGYYTDPLIVTYPPRHQWTVSTGWDLRNPQKLVANNFGYAAHRDFVRSENAVALIGDSYVEASMLDFADRPGQQLELALKIRPVFTMGVPGTSLLDYAERIRYASQQFGIKDFVVVMERFDVLQALCGSGNINGPCLDPKSFARSQTEARPPPNLAKRIFRNSQFAQYLMGQLKVSPNAIWRQILAQLPSRETDKPIDKTIAENKADFYRLGNTISAVDAVGQAFFERVKPFVGGRLVIVLDCDRAALYSGQPASTPERQHFIKLATLAGAKVIDAAPLLEHQWANSKLKFDVGPYDGHLNSLAVGILIRAGAQAIEVQ